jgi:hypothetical protein
LRGRARLSDEEQFLLRNLPGYAAIAIVRFRLVADP